MTSLHINGGRDGGGAAESVNGEGRGEDARTDSRAASLAMLCWLTEQGIAPAREKYNTNFGTGAGGEFRVAGRALRASGVAPGGRF